jgi:putative aminopeptidase FrvX
MNAAARKFLFELLRTPSPTGFETPGQRKWAAYVGKHADSVDNDTYGTAWATLKGTARKPKSIMLEAHADEIGYIVRYVTEEGFLNLDRIGGSDAATGRGRRIHVFGDKGVVKGIIGNTAIHIRENLANEKAPKIHELYVDVGADSAEEVEKLGIRVGHPAVYADEPEEFAAGRIVSRALDNRIGGFIIAQVMAKLAKVRPACTVYCVNAVQEEIGGHGAKMVTYRLMPDVAVCLDVTHATDTPGIKKAIHGDVVLGGGPTVTHGTCNHPNVVERLMQVAKKGKIPLQHESSSRYSGTDTDKIYPVQQGIPSALVSLPLRYMHSSVEVVDLEDVQSVIDILTAFVKSVKPSDDFAIKL